METYLKFDFDILNRDFMDTARLKDFKVDLKIEALEGEFGSQFKFENVAADVDLQQKDKLYLAAGVTIPRVKMKNIYNEFGVKTVRDIDQADKVIIGRKTADVMSDYTWLYRIKTEAFKNFINTLQVDINIDQYYVDKVNTALEFYTNEYVVINDWSDIRLLTQYAFIPGQIKDQDYRSSSSFHYIKDDYKEVYKDLSTRDLYFEDSLLKYINGTDAVTIDETMFKTLSDMFTSNDHDNTVLAMEIMANSNYFDSLVYLLILFEEFGGPISNQRSRNHVNFKGLCAYLDIYPNSIHKDDIVKILLSKEAVTIENMSVLLKYYYEDISNYCGSNYFRVQAVTFTDEISQILEKQLVKKVEIFVPQPKEEPVAEATETQTEEDVIERTDVRFGASPFL
jgi:hypothetical protein